MFLGYAIVDDCDLRDVVFKLVGRAQAIVRRGA